MAGAGGLLVVLIAGLVAILLCVATVAAAGFALLAKDARRGFKFGIAAVVASSVSILLSAPFWLVVLRGKDTHGEPLRFPRDWPLAGVVVFEGAAWAVAIIGTLRQHFRRRSG